MGDEPQTVQSLIATNLRELREAHGLTRDQIAQRARSYGMTWDASSIGRFETQRAAVTLPSLLVLAGTLAELTNVEVPLTRLTDGGNVELTPSLVIDSQAFASYLRGADVRFTADTAIGSGKSPSEVVDAALSVDRGGPKGLTIEDRRTLRMWQHIPSLAERRAAERLNIAETALTQWSLKLWGRPFDDEVNERAGASASPQRRGHITRQLTDEVREAIFRQPPRVEQLRRSKSKGQHGDDRGV